MTKNETTGEETKSRGKALQLILSLIIFAAFVVFLFVPDAALLNASLWSQILDLFKGSLAYDGMIKTAMFAAVGAYAVLLVCTVAAFFCKNKGACALNYIKSLVFLAAMLFFAYALTDELNAGFADVFTDETTYFALNSVSLSTAAALLALIVLNFTVYKAFGIVKLVFAALGISFAAFAGKTFIESYTFQDLLGGIELGSGIANTLAQYAFAALGWAVLVNAVLALFVLILPRTGVLDVIRAAVVFALAAASAILLGVTDSFANLLDYTGTVAFAAIALAQLIFAIVVAVVLHAKKKKAEEEKEAEEDAAFVFDADNQMAFRGLEAPSQANASAQAAPAQAAPAAEATAAEATAAPVSEDAERANRAFEDAAQISIEDIERETGSNEYDDIIRDAQAEPAEEEKPFDFEQAKYDGSFNRAYQEFAEEEERKTQEARKQQEQQQQQAFYGYNRPQTPPPYYGAQQQPYGQQQAYGQQPYYAAGYVPDPFLSSLTPAERDEFDRLFISRIYGENKRLPAYRVGGDNREFFTKIFVFMGRYRNVITDGLLEKIYNFSNSIR